MSINVPTPFEMYVYNHCRNLYVAGSKFGFLYAKGFFHTSEQKKKKIFKELKNFKPELQSGLMFDKEFTEVIFKLSDLLKIINDENLKYERYDNDLVIYVARQQSIGNIKTSFDEQLI